MSCIEIEQVSSDVNMGGVKVDNKEAFDSSRIVDNNSTTLRS